ncbi:MAG: hypothetical protein ABR587_15375 [Candidatus Binatia bacterium]
MSAEEWRLPKLIEADPEAAGLLEQLASRSGPLWKEGRLQIPSVVPDDELKSTLCLASRTGFLLRGLEAAERRLAEEQRGRALLGTSSRDAGVRISRLLVVTNDGAERFYRNVEALLKRHEPRVYAIRVEMDEHEMGELLFGADRVARLVMVDHKNAVAEVLLAIARQWRG